MTNLEIRELLLTLEGESMLGEHTNVYVDGHIDSNNDVIPLG